MFVCYQKIVDHACDFITWDFTCHLAACTVSGEGISTWIWTVSPHVLSVDLNLLFLVVHGTPLTGFT